MAATIATAIERRGDRQSSADLGSERIERYGHEVPIGERETEQDHSGNGEDGESQEANHASLIRPTAEPGRLTPERLFERP